MNLKFNNKLISKFSIFSKKLSPDYLVIYQPTVTTTRVNIATAVVPRKIKLSKGNNKSDRGSGIYKQQQKKQVKCRVFSLIGWKYGKQEAIKSCVVNIYY